MIRFYLAGLFMKFGEWFIARGFEIAGRNGHIEIEFEASEEWPLREWPEWLLVIVFGPPFAVLFWVVIVLLFSLGE